MLNVQLTVPKEYKDMDFVYFNLIWIPKDPVSIDRFQYGKGVPVGSWEPSEKKGFMFAALDMPTSAADQMAVDIIYMKTGCDRYVYRLLIKHNQALKAQPPAAGTPQSGAP